MTVMSRVPPRRSRDRRSSFVAPADYASTVPDALSWRDSLGDRTAPKGQDAWTAASVTQSNRTVVDAGPYGVIDIAPPEPQEEAVRWPHLGVVWWDKRSFVDEGDIGVVDPGFAPAAIGHHVSLSGRPAEAEPDPGPEFSQPPPAARPAVATEVPAPAPAAMPATSFAGPPVPAAPSAPFAPPVSAKRPEGLEEPRRSHVRRSKHAAPVVLTPGGRSRLSASSHPRRARLRRRRARRRIVLGVVLVVVAFVTTVLIQSAFVTPFVVPSASMEGSLMPGDRILVNKLAYVSGAVQRGDVVVFHDPGGWLTGSGGQGDPDDDYLVKRVIGVPGDHVSCCGTDGRVKVNGVELFEPYTVVPPGQPSASGFEVTVPAGALWVLGDNRYNSRDSSQTRSTPSQGFVPVANVVGQATLAVWPFDRFGAIDQARSTFASVPEQTCPT
ncbi:signal peptidase I [Leifsonia sp. C5G2]|uniref:signal peptidase I n=1 Tax=Leifsonia sp. C5G2 TaxID=2735269 RepID=UPI001585B912|nr:signal peptidase I [Leifsonia sp. C5G2]NUU06316.1 signal peptidase I [Leifsonia sp. C5G2]